jgi:5,10-methylenetetrahydromethanopterin reductase
VTDGVEAEARQIKPICASIAQNGGAPFLALAGIDVQVPAMVLHTTGVSGVFLQHVGSYDPPTDLIEAVGSDVLPRLKAND